MLNFVFISAIIFEIALTSFLVVKLIKAQKKVEAINEEVIASGFEIFEKMNETISVVKKINKVVSFLSNKKFATAMAALKIGFIVIQTLIFLRNFKFSNGILENVKKMKKLMYIQITKEILKTVCKYL